MARGVDEHKERFMPFTFNHRLIIGCADIDCRLLHWLFGREDRFEFSIVIIGEENGVMR